MILALALVAATGGAFAQTDVKAEFDSNVAKVEKFLAPNAETLRWEQEDAAQKTKLESQRFPQYVY